MSALRDALFDWDANRVWRVVVTAVALFVAVNYTDGFLLGLGVTIAVGMALDTPRMLYSHWVRSSDQ